VQDEIARRVVEKLRVKFLGVAGESLVRRHTSDLDAYALYLKGRYQWNQWHLRDALGHFEQAIARDPGYALAYVGVADCYIGLGWGGDLKPMEAFPKAKAAATEALRLDESVAEAHATLGYIATFFDWDWPNAARELTRAIELSPNSANCHLFNAWYLNSQDRPDEAIAAVRRACELDPLSMMASANLAYLSFFARRYDQALQHADRTLELDANFIIARAMRALPYIQKGVPEQAIAELQEVLLQHDDPPWLGWLGYAYAKAGRRQEALKVVAALTEPSTRPYVVSIEVARVCVGLGELNDAFRWLEKAYQGRESNLTYLQVDPSFDVLRPDPRFQDLLRRMNFPPQG